MSTPILATLFIDVTLNTTTLNFPDVEVDRPTRLVWQLKGNAEKGTFTAPDDPDHPAFDLLGQAQWAVFDNLQVSEKQITLDDHHREVIREWPYNLWIKLGSNYYGAREKPTSPRIKNK
jgi:hypothetical protein